MIILTGNSNPEFVIKVAKRLFSEHGKCKVGRFSNGEIKLDIDISLRGEKVYIIFSPGSNINEEIMEIFLIAHTAHFASAAKIILVVTCFPYARQDRKTKSRDPISARFMMDLAKAVYINHIITVDFHNGAIQGFTDIPNDNLSPIPIFRGYILKHLMSKYENPLDEFIIVSPDAGGMVRAKNLAQKLQLNVATIYKDRNGPGDISEMKLLGNVGGKRCIIYDDMADTCGTLAKAASLLKTTGAIEVLAFITHGILSGNALNNIAESDISTLYVTDSVNLYDKCKTLEKIKVISITNLVANSILRQYKDDSMGPLFELDDTKLNGMLPKINVRVS